MRLVVLTALTALALVATPPLALRAHAEEVKYKDRGRPKPPADQPGAYKKPPVQPPAQKPPVYKPPIDPPPPSRPPDREHPGKKPPEPKQPPDPHQPPDWQPPTHSNPPPIGGGWTSHPCPPPPCPMPAPGCEQPVIVEEPDDDDVAPVPLPVGILGSVARSVRAMQIEGFTGEVLVGYGGRIEYDQAYNAGGYYHIGSATEAFTAWAIYRLVGEKKLNLRTTLGEVFPFAPADKSAITIEQLLGHTSGLGNTFAADGEHDRDTALRNLFAQPLAHEPGGEFIHSDDGYVILAAVIAVTSGMRYERYLQASGVVTRDMNDTVFWGDLRLGHEQAEWGKRGSGGVFSTAHDLYVWASHFAAQPKYVVDQITGPRTWTDAGVGIGYGWFTSANTDAPVRWTTGTSESDENVTVVLYPAGAVLAVTSDSYNGDVPWSERVANTLQPLLYDWAPPRPYTSKMYANSSTGW